MFLVFILLFVLLQICVADLQPKCSHAQPVPGISWDDFSFSLNNVQTDKMWFDTIEVSELSCFSNKAEECLVPFGNIQMSPAATVLNYGQALFEGMKAFRRVDGSVALFRPERNGMRMQQGARRFLLPPVDLDTFTKAAEEVVRANARWIPPSLAQGALYLRPILMGTGAALGVKPSKHATFCIFCSPVGNYFPADGALQPIRLQAVQGYSRAGPGGAGSVKAAGNYAPAFGVQKQVRARGYNEILCLDAVTGEAVEEAGASNFFAVFAHNNTIVTPTLDTETILPGVTRQSIMELASEECGCTVLEQRLTLEHLRNASEAFCCGTGAVITPVSCVSVMDSQSETETEVITFRGEASGEIGCTGPITRKLYDMLLGIQSGSKPELAKKYEHWIHVVDP